MVKKVNSTKSTSPLTHAQIRQIIEQHKLEYSKATKLGKTKILDNLECVLLVPRKSIIRSLNRSLRQKKTLSYSSENPAKHTTGARGRPITYTPEVDKALEYVWKEYDCPCAERLHPGIKEAVSIFKRDGEWYFSQQATNLLLCMPLNTMRPRLVKLAHKVGLVRGFSTTQASLIKDLVPTFHSDWKDKPLGYGQIDTVVHAGGELIGDMVYTVNFVDMQTYWQEPVAQLTKGDDATLESIRIIEKRLPFPLTGIHPDSGSEFLNWLVVEWCRNKELHNNMKVNLTRSRANKKNDNCNIEERNNHVIRKYVGYERYDCIEAVRAMNELYEVLRLYINHFQTIQKCIGYKTNAQSKKRRVYDIAKTPFLRVLEHPETSDKTKAFLIEEHKTLNPSHLLAKIKALTVNLKRIQRNQGYHA